jgi:phage-related protein
MPTLLFPTDIKPLRTSTIQTIYKKKEVQFQKYRQSSPAGLNNKEYIINAQFIVNEDKRDILLNFFEDTQGYLPFLFNLPGYELGYFTHGSINEACLGGGLFRFEVELKTFNIPMALTTVLTGDTTTVLTVQ